MIADSKVCVCVCARYRFIRAHRSVELITANHGVLTLYSPKDVKVQVSLLLLSSPCLSVSSGSLSEEAAEACPPEPRASSTRHAVSLQPHGPPCQSSGSSGKLSDPADFFNIYMNRQICVTFRGSPDRTGALRNWKLSRIKVSFTCYVLVGFTGQGCQDCTRPGNSFFMLCTQVLRLYTR